MVVGGEIRYDEFCCCQTTKQIFKINLEFFRFRGIFGLRDLSWRILRKISVPNAPFSGLLVPPPSATVVRKLFTKLFGKINNSEQGGSPPLRTRPVPPASRLAVGKVG